MSRRQLSITSIAAAYSAVGADVFGGDVDPDDVRSDSCGAPVPDQSDEVLRCCSKCGHELEKDD